MSSRAQQIEKAATQIKTKVPVPTIDYTQHQLDDGLVVSTQERVVKDVGHRFQHPAYCH